MREKPPVQDPRNAFRPAFEMLGEYLTPQPSQAGFPKMVLQNASE